MSGFEGLTPTLRDLMAGFAMGTTPQESMAMAGRMMAFNAPKREQAQKAQAQRNHTVEWLQSQGVDANTANYLASDPVALRAHFAERQKKGEVKLAEARPLRRHVVDDRHERSRATETVERAEVERAVLWCSQ